MPDLTLDQQIIFLTVSDLEASSKFYGEIFGFRMARDQGSCRIYHLNGNSFIGILVGIPPKEPTGSALCWVTDDVDDCYEKARSHGLDIMFPPRLNEKYQIYHFYLKDPDGLIIEVQRFEEPLE